MEQVQSSDANCLPKPFPHYYETVDKKKCDSPMSTALINCGPLSLLAEVSCTEHFLKGTPGVAVAG